MLLRESNFSNLITESQKDGKDLYLKGVFLQGEAQNRNGRFYPKSEIERAVDKLNESIMNGQPVLGHLDHPETLEVKLESVSHRIDQIAMEGNNAVGKALILPTPNGKIARALIESGIQIGVSSRGSGSVNESTGVVEDFNIVTIDLVATPSAQNAYPKSIYEHLEYYKKREELLKLSEMLHEDSSAQKYFEREIRAFMENLFKK